MATVKTAISIDAPLLERVDMLAKKLGVARSRLLAMAAERLVSEQENAEILAALNEAYRVPLDTTEKAVRRHHRHAHRRSLAGEW